ncbi:hypothetical protein [Rhodococcus wratislaviensis]|uniref:hypothetical protein n=1 Tax=Rhodococcus wratislaviensis TaxID=44752 RepID=UPI003666CFF7
MIVSRRGFRWLRLGELGLHAISFGNPGGSGAVRDSEHFGGEGNGQAVADEHS